jgi:hypothetical protein
MAQPPWKAIWQFLKKLKISQRLGALSCNPSYAEGESRRIAV